MKRRETTDFTINKRSEDEIRVLTKSLRKRERRLGEVGNKIVHVSKKIVEKEWKYVNSRSYK